MNSSLIKTHITGGGERFRTDDLLLAKQALYLLSYTPFSSPSQMVGRGGLEPPTPRLSSVCSNQLSYQPIIVIPRNFRSTVSHGRPYFS